MKEDYVKKRVLPSDMTDQTGVPAVLLIPIRHRSASWDWLLSSSLVCLDLNYKGGHFKPSYGTTQGSAFSANYMPTCFLNKRLWWGHGGHLFLIVSYIVPAAHRFILPISCKVWPDISQGPVSCHSAHPTTCHLLSGSNQILFLAAERRLSNYMSLPWSRHQQHVVIFCISANSFTDNQGYTSLNYIRASGRLRTCYHP